MSLQAEHETYSQVWLPGLLAAAANGKQFLQDELRISECAFNQGTLMWKTCRANRSKVRSSSAPLPCIISLYVIDMLCKHQCWKKYWLHLCPFLMSIWDEAFLGQPGVLAARLGCNFKFGGCEWSTRIIQDLPESKCRLRTRRSKIWRWREAHWSCELLQGSDVLSRFGGGKLHDSALLSRYWRDCLMACLEIRRLSRILFVWARCLSFMARFTLDKCWPDFVSWEDKIHKAILDNFATPRVVEVSWIHPFG